MRDGAPKTLAAFVRSEGACLLVADRLAVQPQLYFMAASHQCRIFSIFHSIYGLVTGGLIFIIFMAMAKKYQPAVLQFLCFPVYSSSYRRSSQLVLSEITDKVNQFHSPP